ncbi:MAG: repressor LexA [Armatimonadetes bacterium RBG_19FT_COMBO_69_19]|nr:MAG: repressor LexA [Armatimonadetes bacterium RBG_19FT_COMBO_69_19]
MGKGLTRRQKEILIFIQRYSDAHGYPPSVREIGQALGLTSSSTVHSHLTALEKKGYLRRDPSKPRALEILKDEREVPVKKVVALPVVGMVTAGLPILAQQNIEDYFPLPQEFVRSEDCFILKVRGDSMIDAGILDGDMLVVHRQPTAKDRDIVVARIEDEATVKRFFKEDGRIRLQPENARMEPTYVRDVAIEGVALAVIRRLN